jgi:hypothetical protein
MRVAIKLHRYLGVTLHRALRRLSIRQRGSDPYVENESAPRREYHSITRSDTSDLIPHMLLSLSFIDTPTCCDI